MSLSNLPVPFVGASAILLLSIPHARQVVTDCGNKKGYISIESSNDDEVITTGKSPRSVWQRVTLGMVAAAATIVALWSCVSTQPVLAPKALHLAMWSMILVQELFLISRRNPEARYRLGHYSALASLAIAISVAWPYASSLHSKSDFKLTSPDASSIVQTIAAVILLFVNLAFPRGPTLYRHGHPVDALNSVSFLSRYTFSWAYKTLAIAAKNKRLNTDDLPLVGDEVRAKTLSDAFFAVSSTSARWRRWLKLYWPEITSQVIIQLFANAVNFLPHFFLFSILRLFEDRDAGARNQLQLWLAALCLGLSMVVKSWSISLRDLVADMKLSLPINEQLLAVISKKAMRLNDVVISTGDSEDDDAASNDGDDDGDDDGPPRTKHSVLNLLGVDVERVSDFVSFAHVLIDCILELGISISFLLYLMGWKSMVAGCAIPVLLIPFYYHLTSRYSGQEQALMDRRDDKSATLTVLMRGMRQIKFSALETQWYDKILGLREKELRNQYTVFQLDVCLYAMWTLGPLCMSCISIATHIYLNGSIAVSAAFTALSLFENLQGVLSLFPETFTELLDALVSLRRIESFLDLAEHEDKRVPGDAISFRDATIAWPSVGSEDAAVQFQLKGLNLDLPPRELTVISGRSGAGKSLLLQALIGEADIVKGTAIVPRASAASWPAGEENWIVDGLVAYVSQDPWIENATIRDAVLFGLPLDAERYDKVIHACALSHDLQSFPDGDRTDIGANGINLSGGQKWRLALARALYSRASILVLDDIFSAVDSNVGRHLYDNALTGPLAKGRTRVLATHHVRLCLRGAAYLVRLENGNVVQAGHPSSLVQDGPSEQSLDDGTSDASDSEPKSRYPSQRTDATPRSDAQPKKYYEEEKRERGVVKAEVYKAYIKASGGYSRWILVIILCVMTLVLNLAAPYWVTVWTRAYNQSPRRAILTQPADHPDFRTGGLHLDHRLVYYSSIYFGLAFASWVLDIIRIQIILGSSIKASKVMFEQFAQTILRAPLRFLDMTPVGQILNRFTSDFGTFDSDLALDLSYLLHSGIMIFGVIVAASVTSPLIVGIGLLTLLASWAVAYFYVTGAREAKRLESTARSPIFELVGSLLTGLPTIRAFGREKAYLKRMYDLIDVHCQALWHKRLFSCWMAFWMSMVGAIFVASVTITFVTIRTLDAALAGFALSYALELSDHIYWLLSQYAKLELDANAAERIVEYTQLDQEPQSGIPVPAYWPHNGEIEVTDLSVSYGPDLPPVLQDLTFTLRPGERVGIVGRTGAGKSSLSLALLRCLDARSGSIHIDGIDIAQVRLHDLRSRVGIIPQDPVVFAGTVREVLDPFAQHDDSELRDALREVGLLPDDHDPEENTAEGLSNGVFSLDASIIEEGRNLSQGQKQLLCLARALVSRPKILIMDEATASIDMESDIRIQRTLRQVVRGCTLLVIAHRLSTIADFDRILVLDGGRVVEMGPPGELMKTENGVFRGLVEESGERMAIERMIEESTGAV
ncbi:ABC transporter ATP-binding protein/permease VMR1 [Aspergillus udagawae]|uniref:ABC transporter ATP-binding protein/permease VMR1 n=1 Tax=Aspergillus udagawae TaxID=91492 RepID=A0ABQ1AFA1_9EURO|nr:ABC transporter ATP-binding protein/permease VMR1 [Aspergillus udagawae]GFG05218.1 ABC transporter ATP-binding protein/permease VMR1 [Aspergillus udagawae]